MNNDRSVYPFLTNKLLEVSARPRRRYLVRNNPPSAHIYYYSYSDGSVGVANAPDSPDSSARQTVTPPPAQTPAR